MSAAATTRHFQIVSAATVSGGRRGDHKLDLWMPTPYADGPQIISDLKVKTSLPYEVQTDPDYSNQILHVCSDGSLPLAVTLQFDCTRREETALFANGQADASKVPAPSDRFLQPDRWGVIDDHIRSMAAQVAGDRPDALAKARAIYNYVLGHMAYDKATPGWGNGDTRRACEIGKGNCIDFSALFISLARASGTRARFKMGCQIPDKQREGAIGGYHCWAEFWAAEVGWVPVDASQAWKDPSRRDYYFGNLDADRIQFSCGRDVRVPGMAGKPLNYLFAPYAEIDGSPVAVDHGLTLASST
jgi:transglutaminase-like putative cysteine protease